MNRPIQFLTPAIIAQLHGDIAPGREFPTRL
jgi:hypothetical protein